MAKFPDLTGDGQVTQADVLKGRGVYKKGGSVMKHDHGHKPTVKMSHGGHYCWGGKVMKKAEGGEVKSSKLQKKDEDYVSRKHPDVQKMMGLPVSVYVNGKYDSDLSKKAIDENFDEGLRQDREEHGKEMKKKYGSNEDYSYKYPSDSYDSILPKGKSYKTKATEGMMRGGKVMKKVEGGTVKKYKTIEDIIEETKGIEVKAEPRRKSTIPEMTTQEMRRVKKTVDDEDRQRRYDEETEDMRENPMNYAKGGFAKMAGETKRSVKDQAVANMQKTNYAGGGKVKKVMHEFKAGELHSGSKKGPVVKSRKQAIAIALSEARKGKK